MMRARSRFFGTPLAVNITSLSDIMLSLLIFFMLVSKKGVDTGADKSLELPTTFRGLSIDDFGNTVTLNVYPGLTDEPLVTTLHPLTFEPRRLAITDAGGKPELRDFLATLRAANPNLKVVLRADGQTEARFIEPALLAVTNAGLGEVNYAAARPGGEG